MAASLAFRVKGLPQGEGLARAHVGVVGAVDVVRDGKRHLEGVAVQLVAVVGEHQGGAHQLGQAAGVDLFGAVFFVDNNIGVGVDDVGAGGLDLIVGAGVVANGPGGQSQASNENREGENQCKKPFHVDISFKTI